MLIFMFWKPAKNSAVIACYLQVIRSEEVPALAQKILWNLLYRINLTPLLLIMEMPSFGIHKKNATD